MMATVDCACSIIDCWSPAATGLCFCGLITFSAINSPSLRVKIHPLKNKVKYSVSQYCNNMSHIVSFKSERNRRKP